MSTEGSRSTERAREADREATERPTSVPPYRPLCDLCGSLMRESHCKLICDQCGYTRDCSDP